MANLKAFSEKTSSGSFELITWYQAVTGEGRC